MIGPLDHRTIGPLILQKNRLFDEFNDLDNFDGFDTDDFDD